MLNLGWIIIWLGSLWTLAYHKASLLNTSFSILGLLLITTIFSDLSWIFLLILWSLCATLAILLNHSDYRRKYITSPIFDLFHSKLPTLSETERQALETGSVGWDKELFGGSPNFNALLKVAAPKLSLDEQAFLDGPVNKLCEMVNDWQITHTDQDLSPETWAYIKKEGFFGLIIAKKFQGKDFSAYAHSMILRKLASRSITLGVTVAVPNSLGPAELLTHYGTQDQQNYYLPRLAQGIDIPCFALTSEHAGSDAASIQDTGIVAEGFFNGKPILGIRLTFHKRYITLAPIATLLGLAFVLSDPNQLLPKKQKLGISCALIPMDTPGIIRGARHYPLNVPFQNGPVEGVDVFIPFDYLIGGLTHAAEGWSMLMNCLSRGRGISIPALSLGALQLSCLSTNAYSVIRQQFKHPINQFEGIQEALARIISHSYITEALCNFTTSYIDQGQNPAILGAITKYHATEIVRGSTKDIMDIFGGKAIMMGPSNLWANLHMATPIMSTVEGANILTRSLIVFGQGAIQCHPFILKEIEAVSKHDLPLFEKLFAQHIRHILSNGAKALFHALTFAQFAKSPSLRGEIDNRLYQQLSQASAAFAFISDICLALLGAKLKKKESLSARLGDLLSMMVLGSAILKHFSDQNKPLEQYPLVTACVQQILANFWQTMKALINNLPNPLVRCMLHCVIMPLGCPVLTPKDSVNQELTTLLNQPSATRDALIKQIFISTDPADPLHLINITFDSLIETKTLRQRLAMAIEHKEIESTHFLDCVNQSLKAKIISADEAEQLIRSEHYCQQVIHVDSF